MFSILHNTEEIRHVTPTEFGNPGKLICYKHATPNGVVLH
jgi:hypothetical protein